jgi:hypothetical protein
VSWHIVSRMCWRRLLPNGCHRNAPVARLQGCCVIYEISKRDIVELVSAIEHRGAPVAANKALKSIKTFLRWCVGRAILDQSPAKGVPLPSKEVARDRVLDDDELAPVILAARCLYHRQIGWLCSFNDASSVDTDLMISPSSEPA